MQIVLPADERLVADECEVEDVGASGLAAVWARENTRESIWDAMKRKEVYATTGTRLKVRVFGGWGIGLMRVEQMHPEEEW